MAELRYLDFDLSIEAGEGQYRARVLNSPAGEAKGTFSQPFSELELENFYLRVGRPRQGVRRLDSPEMQAARNFGARLFEAAFSDEVYACFRASLNEAQAQDKGLRLRLRVNVPELSSLPWEYLYNSSLDRFLSLSVETPIVRYLDMPQRPRALAVGPPLNVLAMISSPGDFPPLDVEREWRQLKGAVAELEQRGLLTLDRLERASLAVLQRRLRRDEVHILHYIGHGKFDERAQDGLLLFEDETGRGRPLSGAYLGTILHNHRPLRLVVLNACEGARTSSADPYSGAAQSLVRQGIPAVVAMQFEITDRAAITFGREFYSALSDGYPVDAALVEARTAIFAQGNDIEWGTPVYFTRAPEGRVFDLSAASAREPPATEALPEIDPDLESRLERAYWEAVSAYHLGDWETAREKFHTVTRERTEYRDASARLIEVEEQIERRELYDRAKAAIQAEDWQPALQSLDKLVARDPKFKDAAAMLETVRKQVHLASLYAQARNLSQRGHWGAVISVFKKIETLQPEYADPDSLLAAAQRELGTQERREKLDGLYRQALEAMNSGEWESAVTTLEQLLEMNANYLNSAELLERAKVEQAKQEKEARLAMLLNEAGAACERENWDQAIQKLETILTLEPQHAEAQTKLDWADKQRELAKLYGKAQQQQRSKRLEQALESLERIQTIDAGYRDVAMQIGAVRRQLAERERQAPVARPEKIPGKRRLPVWVWGAAGLTALIVLIGLAVGLGWISGVFDEGGTPTIATISILPATRTAEALAALSTRSLVPTPSNTLAPIFSDTPMPMPTYTSSPWPTDTRVSASPTLSDTPAPIQTPSPWPTDTPIPASSTATTSKTAQIIDNYGVPMAMVPSGPFEMGEGADVALAECQKFHSHCRRSDFEDAEPVHTITLDDFYIDVYEVTNELYARCVEAGTCDPPSLFCDNFGKTEYSDHPVVCVIWSEAQAYCTWRGARLPTEAEWEKAARGGLVGALYPWGDDAPVCTPGAKNGANISNCSPRDTMPVGNFSPNGYGLYDMVGNVDEWVADWYSEYYYAYSIVSVNPQGPTSGQRRVLRGNLWSNWVANRLDVKPDYWTHSTGFRCARSP